MRLNQTALVVLTMTSLGMAAITGKVVDANSDGVSGALVLIEGGGASIVTGPDGGFSLSSTTAISGRVVQSLLPYELSAVIHNGTIHVNVSKKSAVTITVFGLNGSQVIKIQQAMNVGTHSIFLPRFATGVYLYKIQSENDRLMLKSYVVGGVSTHASTMGHGANMIRDSKPLNKSASIAGGIIAITRPGFLNYRMMMPNLDTNGILIKMIASAGTVTDAEGNVYQTVKIGGQEWMAENLRTTKFADGTMIPFSPDGVSWGTTGDPAYCYYGNSTDPDSTKKSGALYNWYAANSNKLLVSGWHLPTDSDWLSLANYMVINGGNWDASMDTLMPNKVAKCMASMADWKADTSAGTIGNELTNNNSKGFSALPAGVRYPSGQFEGLGSSARWWSATNPVNQGASYRALEYQGNGLGMPLSYNGLVMKTCGYSVRLVKGN